VTGQAVTPPLVHRHPLTHVVFSPDGRRLATATWWETAAEGVSAVTLWDVATGQRVRPPLEHSAPLESVAFSADGGRLLTVFDWTRGRDEPVPDTCVWDTATGRAVLALKGEVKHAEFSPDGRRVLVRLEDDREENSLRVYDAASGAAVTPPLKRSASADWKAAFSGDGRWVLLISSAGPGRQSEVRVWEAATGRPAGAPLRQGDRAIFHATLSPDGRRLLTVGSQDLTVNGPGEAQVWDVATARPVTPPMPHGRGIFHGARHAAFTPDGRQVVTVTDDGARWLWDAAIGRLALAPRKHGPDSDWDHPPEVTVSPNGLHLAQVTHDGAARVWHMHTLEPLTPPLRHAARVTHVAFSPDGARLLTAGRDGRVCLWDLAAGPPELLPAEHRELWLNVHVSPFGRHALVTRQFGPRVQLWDAEAGQPLAPPADVPVSLAGEVVVFSPDGRRAFVMGGTQSGSRIGDLRTGEWVRVGDGAHGDDGPRAAFSPDGRLLLTVAGNVFGQGAARLWDAATGKPACPPLKLDVSVADAQFSLDGRRVLTVGNRWEGGEAKDGQARVWDAATGQPVGPVLRCPGSVAHGALSPDGRRVLTVRNDPDPGPLFHKKGTGAVQLWEAVTGKPVGPPLPHSRPVRGAFFSPTGRHFLTVSDSAEPWRWWASDEEGRLWDAATGQPIRLPVPFRSGEFSRDGRLLAVVTEDWEAAQVCDAATGRPVSPLLRHGEELRHLAFSADGRRLLTCGLGKARVWDVATGEPLTPFLAAPYRKLFLSFNGPATEPERAWPLPTEDRRLEDLALLAQALSCYRIDAEGNYAPVDGAALRGHWEALQAKPRRDDPGLSRRVLSWHRRAAQDCAAGREWRGALLHLDRLLAAEPKSWKLHFDRGRALARLGRDEEAITAWSRAADLGADWHAVWESRGDAHARRGRWEKAAADLARAMELGAERAPVGHRLALAYLAAGQRDPYRRLCANLLRRPGGILYPGHANRDAWPFVLAPNAVTDFAPVLELAGRPVGNGHRSYHELLTLGTVLYRAGRFKEAAQRLQEAVQAHGKEGTPPARLFLAMASYRLGDRAAAGRWLDRAASAIAEEEREELAWHQRLELRLLRQEAEALTGGAGGKR
ncbi:MAG TPA: tetratricopeptide repeat protein, partial [Gemmataceae bacterium]|nr:tetratricopeptide repeat protein [Gemmataceae bacterium]